MERAGLIMGLNTPFAPGFPAPSADALPGPASGGLRILVHGLNFWPDLTGIAKYTFEMAHWLVRRGHEVRVVTAPPYYPEWKIRDGYRWPPFTRESVGGIEVLRCRAWGPAKQTTPARIALAASFGASSWVPTVRAALSWRPDLVWTVAPSMIAARTALSAARIAGAPAWLHVQDLEADAAFALGMLGGESVRRVALSLESRFIRRFDRVSTICDAMFGRLIEKGCDPARTGLVPNWVDLQEIRPLEGPNRFRAESGIADGEVMALYAGSMGRKQGLPLILEAAAKLKSLPRLRFVLAGEGSERAMLQAAAVGMSNVTFLPLQPVERLPELLSAADIHLLPQLADAADLVLPSKLTGIMASGRPVVATTAPGTDLARESAPCGIVTPPGDADAFAAAIATLASDEEQRVRLGRIGRQRAARQWDRDLVLGRLEAEFLTLARQATPAISPGV